MPTACHLLGPPELLHAPPLSAEATTTTTTIDALTAQLKALDSSVEGEENEAPEAFMGLTENQSPTLLSSGNPCLDFFFHVVPDTPPEDLIGQLKLAWNHNPLTTLKLICNLRGVRGTGKSDKEGFYTAAFWLHCYHPKTLAGNVKAFADFGYFKDLLEILYRILEGLLVRKFQKNGRKRKFRARRRGGRYWTEIEDDLDYDDEEEVDFGEENEREKEKKMNEEEKENKEEKKNKEEKEKKEKKVISEEERKMEKEKARTSRKERELIKAKRAIKRYNNDENYRFLHDNVSDFFVELLRVDMENLSAGHLDKITLASKWCPTVDSSYDKATLMCESIARKMFPKEKFSEYEGLEERHYVYRVRNRLRKEVLVPLHKALELPEVFMSANQWNALPYRRVPSVAMKNYKGLFMKHDSERFEDYLEQVKSGKAKIAAGALLPHEIIMALGDEDDGEVAELQWKRMIDDLAKMGNLSNCIAVCDVSGSMSGIPMEVSVALGVLISELSEEPWKGKLITFSADPELQKVQGDTLKAKTEFVRSMAWGMNTNFQKVFDRILEVAIEGKLSEEQLTKRLFVFSDMEFDQASENPWETDYQAIQRKFRENDYQNVPEIVFWNLRDSRSTPVVANQAGVALVSGFSKNLLSMFLEGGGIVNPLEVMELAIADEEYKKLVVFD